MKLRFCNWIPWKERESYRYVFLPGIYVISISHKNLAYKPFSWQDVVYVGITKSKKGLRQRWSQLNTAINGGGLHSGGISMCNDLGKYKNWKKKMFVAAHTIDCDADKITRRPSDLEKLGWIVYWEYYALSIYKRLNHKEPKYNIQ